MHYRIETSAIVGLGAAKVDIEVRVRKGRPGCSIIGLADNAVRESCDRVKEAIEASGFRWPGRLLINLAPAELKKEGSSFDLPIALAVLLATRQIQSTPDNRQRIFGELSLDGSVRPVKGMVAHAILAASDGIDTVVGPVENSGEAALVSGVDIVPVSCLGQAVRYLQDGVIEDVADLRPRKQKESLKLSDVQGQETAKRAAKIAVAGGHNLLFIGPPGCGKSMLAQRIPQLLPRLTSTERLEVARIYSTAGLPVDDILEGHRPYRAPHHVITEVGLCGGGGRVLRAGEASLAHCGLLFLDEFPEFRRSAIEALRTPLENGFVQVSRASGSQRFPAAFQLVAAMNPCPCGRLGTKNGGCECSQQSIATYLKKLSQPILERIDLHVELDSVEITGFREGLHKSVVETEREEPHQESARVRTLQIERDKTLASRLELKTLLQPGRIAADAVELLERASAKSQMSMRSFVRILRVSQTIADLEGSSQILALHVVEALRFRALDKIRKYSSIN